MALAEAVATLLRAAVARTDDFITAVGEIGMNAVVHVGAGIGQVFAGQDAVQVRVTDTGRGITLEHLPSAALRKGYSTAGAMGHGMKMALQTADRVWLLTGHTGTTVTLEQGRFPHVSQWLQIEN